MSKLYVIKRHEVDEQGRDLTIPKVVHGYRNRKKAEWALEQLLKIDEHVPIMYKGLPRIAYDNSVMISEAAYATHKIWEIEYE